MKRNFVGKVDRVMWAMCIAAYVLCADYYSPLSIVRADLDDGSLVEETPFGSSPKEERFITLVATLAMYVALDPDTYKAKNLEKIPKTVLQVIAEMLREQGKIANRDVVMQQRDRLLEIAADILRKHHLYHLRLAAALMKGPLDACVIETMKALYYDDFDDVA